MKSFRIVINVKYVERTIPDDMAVQLHDNLTRCIERAELLNDSELEAEIAEYDVKVEDL